MDKKIRRLDVDASIIQKLEKCRIIFWQDLFNKTEGELMYLLDLPLPSVRDILQKASLRLAPQSTTTLQLRETMLQKPQHLPTALGVLDGHLGGGIPAGMVTEIVGPSGVGKTQLCLTMCVQSCIPKPARADGAAKRGTVVYVDTEGAFSSQRMMEIAKNRYPTFFDSAASVHELGGRVRVFKPDSSEELLKILKSLSDYIAENNAELVIVDSMAALVTKEFGGSAGGQSLAKRSDLLAREAQILKKIAESFTIPVIVTNHVTSRFQSRGGPSYLTAALGNTWAHCVNVRLVLEELSGESSAPSAGTVRQIKISKSPICAPGTCPYIITRRGIESVEAPIPPTRATSDGSELVIASRQSNIAGFSSIKGQHAVLTGVQNVAIEHIQIQKNQIAAAAAAVSDQPRRTFNQPPARKAGESKAPPAPPTAAPQTFFGDDDESFEAALAAYVEPGEMDVGHLPLVSQDQPTFEELEDGEYIGNDYLEELSQAGLGDF